MIPLHVLMIDDNHSDHALFIVAAAESAPGLRVQAVDTSRDIRSFLRGATPHDTPDAIVLDANLPGHDLVALIAEMRCSPRAGRIPIFVLDHATPEVGDPTWVRAGATAVRRNPTDKSGYVELAREVGEACTASRLLRTKREADNASTARGSKSTPR